jgi:hypothetical protein
LAAIIGCVFAQNEQNLCGSRSDNTQLIFVNDPANCANYLWCNFNVENSLDSVHQGECPAGFFFNPTAQACDAQFTCATDLCQEVGVDTEPALRVSLTCVKFLKNF